MIIEKPISVPKPTKKERDRIKEQRKRTEKDTYVAREIIELDDWNVE